MLSSINLVVTSVIVCSLWFSRTFLPDFITRPILDFTDYVGSFGARSAIAGDFDVGFLMILAIVTPLVLVVVAKSRQRLFEIR